MDVLITEELVFPPMVFDVITMDEPGFYERVDDQPNWFPFIVFIGGIRDITDVQPESIGDTRGVIDHRVIEIVHSISFIDSGGVVVVMILGHHDRVCQ